MKKYLIHFLVWREPIVYLKQCGSSQTRSSDRLAAFCQRFAIDPETSASAGGKRRPGGDMDIVLFMVPVQKTLILLDDS